MTEAEVMKELAVAFEYTYKHDDWVTPLSEVLQGVSSEEALWLPAPKGKSIWDITLHLAKWNENIVERVYWREPSHPEEDAHWPKPPRAPTEADWLEAQGRLDRSIRSVGEMLASASLDKIQAGKYGLADVLCRFAHLAYHIGQMTKIREQYEHRRPVDGTA